MRFNDGTKRDSHHVLGNVVIEDLEKVAALLAEASDIISDNVPYTILFDQDDALLSSLAEHYRHLSIAAHFYQFHKHEDYEEVTF